MKTFKSCHVIFHLLRSRLYSILSNYYQVYMGKSLH